MPEFTNNKHYVCKCGAYEDAPLGFFYAQHRGKGHKIRKVTCRKNCKYCDMAHNKEREVTYDTTYAVCNCNSQITDPRCKGEHHYHMEQTKGSTRQS